MKRHTTTLLPDGRLLVAGGLTLENLPTSTVYVYDSKGPAGWVQTGSMAVPRAFHTATILPTGKVLVAGGDPDGSSAEIYDPSTGQWALTSPVPDGPRVRHTATLLADGRVLVAGGRGNETQTARAALFDPSTETWSRTASMPRPSESHTATLLPDGRVLVAGGMKTDVLIPDVLDWIDSIASAAIFDPSTESWSSVVAMERTRVGHTATLLPNGKVLVMGGLSVHGQSIGSLSPQTFREAEWFDPVSSSWQTLPEFMINDRADHSATLLPNGRILLAGGWSFDDSAQQTNFLAGVELYDVSGGPPVSGQSLGQAHAEHTATLLPDGGVLIVGGLDGLYAFQAAGVELQQWAQPAWRGADFPFQPLRRFHTATLLTDGLVLIAGGFDYVETLASAELVDAGSNGLEPTSPLNVPRDRHTATLLPNGRVLVVGGRGTDGESLASAEEYDPRSGEWKLTGSLEVPRLRHTATLLPSGLVLVTGGYNGTNGYLASAEIYHPATRTWRRTNPMNVARRNHTATLLPGGKVVVAGGRDLNGVHLSTEIFDAATETWVPSSPMGAARTLHTAALLADGTVLVAGGSSDAGLLDSAEIYDPRLDQWRATPSMISGRRLHSSILLPDGRLLVMGGRDQVSSLAECEIYDSRLGSWERAAGMVAPRNSQTVVLLTDGGLLVTGGALVGTDPGAELYDAGLGFNPAWQPQIRSAPASITQGRRVMLTGVGFRGQSEGSSGTSRDSPTDYPLMQMRHLENGYTRFVPPNATAGWTATSIESSRTDDFPIGPVLVTLLVNAIPSESIVLGIRDTRPPSVALVGPSPFPVPLGALFDDPGATAVDEIAGDLTSGIVTSGSVDTKTSAAYVRTYSVIDPSGNVGQTNRTVWVMAMTGSPGTVQVSGSVSPAGLLTVAWVEYGRTSNFEATAPQPVGAGYELASLTVTLTNLAPNSIYYYRFVSSNSLGTFYAPVQEITTGSYNVPGDANADGVVDETELDTVLSHYWPTSPWLFITNVAGLGQSHVTFALPQSTEGAFSVQVSTNLLDWEYLGPATPRYEFLDTNTSDQPGRYYRLTWP